MNENAKKLVAALRNGKYTQTTGQLKRKVTARKYAYCCLGVACDLYRKETGGGKWSGEKFVADKEWIGAALPDAVRDWLGFRTKNGAIKTFTLAMLNDNGKSFSEIADIIESEPDGLFA